MNVAFNKNDGLLGRSGQAFGKESAKYKSKVVFDELVFHLLALILGANLHLKAECQALPLLTFMLIYFFGAVLAVALTHYYLDINLFFDF